jgi:predicted nuclease of predicted toxin-antitoxin system
MATIAKFEDLEIWQEARKLAKEIYLISKDTDLKTDYRFKDQIKASSGSVMDKLQKDLKEMEILSFVNFSQLQKVRQENQDHKFIDFSITNIF